MKMMKQYREEKKKNKHKLEGLVDCGTGLKDRGLDGLAVSLTLHFDVKLTFAFLVVVKIAQASDCL